MRVKLDEDLPIDIADVMRAVGHDVETVHSEGFSGFSDDQLWPEVQREGRMLLTADKGFANARQYPPGTHAGIVFAAFLASPVLGMFDSPVCLSTE